MIQQLVSRLAAGSGTTQAEAAARVLRADPLDLVLHMEQVWDEANLWAPNPRPAGPARATLIGFGEFLGFPPAASPAWDHLAYAFAIENTRAPQIFARVVRSFRSGEGLGIPSVSTQRWLDATEVLLFSAANPLALWLSTSAVRPDPEAVRRNAYYRMFGMDIAHGTDSNQPFVYDKAEAANRTFVSLLEELLHELWRAIENVRNIAGTNSADDDRIYRLAEQIGFMLRSRRQNALLGREELSAVTAMGWIDLTLSANSPVVIDLRAEATSPGDRLKVIGSRVGLAPHSRAGSFFAMASELSMLLRALEGGWVTDSGTAWLLYLSAPPPGTPPPLPPEARPLGSEVRRVITEWAAASGRDLKQRVLPVPVATSNGRTMVPR